MVFWLEYYPIFWPFRPHCSPPSLQRAWLACSRHHCGSSLCTGLPPLLSWITEIRRYVIFSISPELALRNNMGRFLASGFRPKSSETPYGRSGARIERRLLWLYFSSCSRPPKCPANCDPRPNLNRAFGTRRLIADAGEIWPYRDGCWFFRPVCHISQTRRNRFGPSRQHERRTGGFGDAVCFLSG